MTPLSASEFAREARRAAQAHTGESIEPEQPSPPAPTPAPQRKAAPVPVREERVTPYTGLSNNSVTSMGNMPPKYIPPSSAFPHAMPVVKVDLPGDGSPEAITDYFNRTYGMARPNSTSERAKRLCGKLAANATMEGYVSQGAWWENWTRIRRGEE